VNQNEDKAAVAAAEAGIKALPEDKRDNPSLQMQLGTAQMKAGMTVEGSRTLVALLKTSDDAEILNDAAYALADARQQLDVAEASARTALGKLDEESRSWTLDENVQTLRAKSNLIVATWDTMGWILFREHKTVDGESYVRAAWMNQRSLVVGEHMGDVLAARGDKAGAVTMYQDALGTIPPYNALGQRNEKQPDEVRVRSKLERLKPGAGRAKAPEDTIPIRGTSPVIVKMAGPSPRTIPLGPAEGKNGTAMFKLLLSVNGVERAVPVGDKEIAGGAEMVKKAKLDGYFPKGSDARLVEGGYLNWHSEVCELVLVP
jgi:uncharacterized protein with PhoU and TrkA domain